MEGLIPFLIHTIKRQHQHSHKYRCLSDGSRRSYHLLTSAGNSINGSSHHRRSQSEFTPPASMDLQPQVEDFLRSRSFKTNDGNNNNTHGLRETHQTASAHNYDYNNYNYSYDNSKHVSMGTKKAGKF